MFTRPEGSSQAQGSSILYFRVPNLQQAYQTLHDRGVRFHGAPHLIARMNTYDLWMAFFYDSEDNMMALMSEVPRGAQ